jgi:hypothetical protein
MTLVSVAGCGVCCSQARWRPSRSPTRSETLPLQCPCRILCAPIRSPCALAGSTDSIVRLCGDDYDVRRLRRFVGRKSPFNRHEFHRLRYRRRYVQMVWARRCQSRRMAGDRNTHPSRSEVAEVAELAVGVPVQERRTYRTARHRRSLRHIQLLCLLPATQRSRLRPGPRTAATMSAKRLAVLSIANLLAGRSYFQQRCYNSAQSTLQEQSGVSSESARGVHPAAHPAVLVQGGRRLKSRGLGIACVGTIAA